MRCYEVIFIYETQRTHLCYAAMQITDKILNNPGSSWMELFDKVDFFGMYKTYVQVVASASSSEAIKDW